MAMICRGIARLRLIQKFSALRRVQVESDKNACAPGNRRKVGRERLAMVGKPVQDEEAGMIKGMKRSAVTDSHITTSMTEDMLELELSTVVKDWLSSFRRLDPRYQILNFFNDLALEGIEEFESQGCDARSSFLMPKILQGFIRCGVFSVWRPTSNDAIRKMMTGEGTGKGCKFTRRMFELLFMLFVY